MTTPEPATFVARTPTDLIAMVPVVLGFHPKDSVVLLTFGPSGRAFHARIDLPVTAEEQQEVAGVLLEAVLSNGVRRAAVLLYTGDVRAAESQALFLVVGLVEHGVDVVDVVRVEDDHWFPVPDEGSPGTAYELATHTLTAQRVFEGKVVHRDRAALADTLVGTDDADATQVALAATRYADLALARGRRDGDPDAGRRFLREEARWLQRCIRGHLEPMEPMAPVDAGRLLVLASVVLTRDVAWAEISRDTAAAHVELWRALVRRAPRDLLPGAAALLAFAAWQHGDGALAWCAVDRCLEVDPDHSMARCVAETLTRAVPPGLWDPIREEELPVFGPDLAPDAPQDRAS